MICTLCDKEITNLQWRPFEDVCLECTPKVEATDFVEGDPLKTQYGTICTPIKFNWRLREQGPEKL